MACTIERDRPHGQEALLRGSRAYKWKLAAFADPDLARPARHRPHRKLRVRNCPAQTASTSTSPSSRVSERTPPRAHITTSPALADEPDAQEDNLRLPVGEERGRCGRRACDGGSHGEAMGNVPLLPGAGYAASLSPTGLLARHRSDLFLLGTTNGDGLHLATALPSSSRPPVAVGDLTQAQVLRRRRAPAPRRKDQVPRIRGAGGRLLDAFRAQGGKAKRGDGGEAMQRVEARDGLCGEAGGEVKEEALLSKTLMKRYSDAVAFAGILGSRLTILSTFASDRKDDDAFGTASTTNSYTPTEPLCVAIITPVVHYAMGGLAVDPSGRSLSSITHTPIPGLWAAGEVIGGAHGHGRHRLAGSRCSR
ncbi:hypothetical protein C8R45DRAFT_1214659 [Mycena sanguinolenta]|nr:hypothetical protein C8R45DRAFT_1214659 [Mycena sanguinolenta]